MIGYGAGWAAPHRKCSISGPDRDCSDDKTTASRNCRWQCRIMPPALMQQPFSGLLFSGWLSVGVLGSSSLLAVVRRAAIVRPAADEPRDQRAERPSVLPSARDQATCSVLTAEASDTHAIPGDLSQSCSDLDSRGGNRERGAIQPRPKSDIERG